MLTNAIAEANVEAQMVNKWEVSFVCIQFKSMARTRIKLHAFTHVYVRH